MRNQTIILLFISLLFSSCDSSSKAPDDLIPKEKMAHILKDLMLLEATYNTKLIRVDNKNELMRNYSDEILQHHNVTKEEFDRSYDYYSLNTEEFEAVYELVFEELTKMETEANALPSKPVKDTIIIE